MPDERNSSIGRTIRSRSEGEKRGLWCETIDEMRSMIKDAASAGLAGLIGPKG